MNTHVFIGVMWDYVLSYAANYEVFIFYLFFVSVFWISDVFLLKTIPNNYASPTSEPNRKEITTSS